AEAIRRSLLGGFTPAFRVKIGAAIGDTIFLIMAYYFISAILPYQTLCHTFALLGSAMLLFVGYKNIRKSLSPKQDEYVLKESLKGGTWLGMGIALTSPFAFAWWFSVFAASLADGGQIATFSGLMENMYI